MKSIPIHQMFRKAVLIPLFSIAFLSGAPYATAAQTSLSPKAELADGEYAIELSMTGGSGKASVQQRGDEFTFYNSSSGSHQRT